MNSAEKKCFTDMERKYVPVLLDHCISHFSGKHLPSHDHLHHLRVWCYARDLLLKSQGICENLTKKEVLLLMLAVFFHDTGLTKTLSEDHGIESRKICQNFLTNNPEMFSFDADQALQAIEFHDQKESEIALVTKSKMNILKLLSICDDIDAYGAIGILRYAEIYLLRGLSFASLPGRVIKNMSCRFNHISSQNWIPGLFLAKHEARYHYAIKFYQEMGEEMFSEDKNQNNRKILESYMNEVYRGKKNIFEYADSIKNSNNLIKKEFASNLINDLKQNHIND